MKLLTEQEQKLVADLIVCTKPEKIKNPYTGESVELCPEGVALYDMIKGAEMVSDFDNVETGLAIFRRNWPAEYIILLD